MKSGGTDDTFKVFWIEGKERKRERERERESIAEQSS